MDSITNSKVMIAEGDKVGVRSLAHNISGVKRRSSVSGWGLRRLTSKSITYMDLHKTKQ